MMVASIFCEMVNWRSLMSFLQTLGFIITIKEGMNSSSKKVKGNFLDGSGFDAEWVDKYIELTITPNLDESGEAQRAEILRKFGQLGLKHVEEEDEAPILTYCIPFELIYAPSLQLRNSQAHRKKYYPQSNYRTY